MDWKRRESSDIPREALEILSRFQTYAEVSPSGKGAHISFLGQPPPDTCRKTPLAEGVDLKISWGVRFFSHLRDGLSTTTKSKTSKSHSMPSFGISDSRGNQI